MNRRPVWIALLSLLVLLPALAAIICNSAEAQTQQQKLDWKALDDEALGYFRTYLQFDTTNPPSNTAQAMAYIKAILDKEGIENQAFESKLGMVSLVAKIRGPEGKKPLLLLSHADVVPAIASNWFHPPFGADLDEGFVWARGAIDNKAHGIMALMTLLAIKRQNIPLRRGVEMMINPDEEAGGANGAEWMAANHWDAFDPAYAINEGGEGEPGWLWNKDVTFLVAVSEKRVFWLHLTVNGHAGHGSVPRPDNPNLILVNALHRLIEKEPDWRITPIFAEAMESVAATQSFPRSFELDHLSWPFMANLAVKGILRPYDIRALMRDTISLTMLNSGYKVNVVPSEASAGIDCRLLPGTDPDAFLRHVRDLLDDDRISIDVLQKPDEAEPSPTSGEAWAAIKDVVARDFKGASVVPWMTTGGTDSRFLREHGVPSYGFVPIILPSSEIERVHGDNERLSIDNLKRGIRATYDLTMDICGPKQ